MGKYHSGGQVAMFRYGKSPAVIHSVLGSCAAIILYLIARFEHMPDS